MAKRNSYASFVSQKKVASTPVNIQVSPDQIKGLAGGYGYKIDQWKQLDRFLILGAAAPTYYASQQKVVKENADAIIRAIREDGRRVVDRAVEISDGGRAPSNDPAIFVLALATAHGDDVTKAHAFRSLPKICRTGTHLFHFCEMAGELRGWGRGLQKAVASWFNDRDAKSLAYQVTKYRQRDGWSMRDVLRVSHPKQHAKVISEQHQAIYHYLTKGWKNVGDIPHPDKALQTIWAFERAKHVTSEKEIARMVRDYRMPWEFLDTKWLNSQAVWEALMEDIKPEALTRNLGRLTANGFIKDFNGGLTKAVVAKLTDAQSLRAARLHPFKIFTAMKTYQQGHGIKGSLTWHPNQSVVNALDEAFYLAHQFVEPTNKNILVAIDVSGSMDTYAVTGLPMKARDAACAMAMTIARTEPNHKLVAISSGLTEMKISARQRLDDVVSYTRSLPFQRTDLSLPMVTAMAKGWEVDAFVTITDNDVNHGIHPSKALEQYRQKSGRDARSVVIACTPSNFTIADPNDHRQLDIVGCDTAVPQLVSDFIAGRLM